mgnify:CR=1 FL=1
MFEVLLKVCRYKSYIDRYFNWPLFLTSMSILNKFGQKMKKRRLALGLSQERLAFMTKLHRTYISDVERGNRNISLINIEKISKSLKVNLGDFLNDL